jgi:predicted Zn-dependent protease
MYQTDPASWRVHQVLAQSFVESDRLDDAIKECQEAIRLKPDEQGLHETLADVYWKQNQLPSAETEFQNELKLDVGNLSSMYKLAVVSLERSKPDVAFGLLTEVLRRQPNSADAHYQMGRAQSQLNQIEAAIRNFSAAVIASGQTDTETLRQSYYQLSQLYRRAQKPEESKVALESFMRLKQQADTQRDQKLQDKMKRSTESSNTVQ